MGWQEVGVALASSRVGGWLYLNVFTRVDRVLLPLTRGRLSSALGTRVHHNLVLLTTIGAKSGRPRRVPLLALQDGDNVVLIASRGGHPRHPAWYGNLRANSRAMVQLGDRTIAAIAREAEGQERAELWRKAVALYPGYATYQARTARRIPVVVLSPSGPDQ